MSIKKWHVLGILFVFFLGSLLHFVYDWSGQNTIVGLFSPVNESTWEHLKLLFFPFLLITMTEYFIYGRDTSNFLLIRALSSIIGMATIVMLFYTYVGIIGQHYLVIDIAIFLLGIIVAFWFSYRSLNSNTFKWSNLIGLMLFIILTLCFIVFTFRPPHVQLFVDPITGNYGVTK
jgi:hypothetical protein